MESVAGVVPKFMFINIDCAFAHWEKPISAPKALTLTGYHYVYKHKNAKGAADAAPFLIYRQSKNKLFSDYFLLSFRIHFTCELKNRYDAHRSV